MAPSTPESSGRAQASFPTSRSSRPAPGGARSTRNFHKLGIDGFWNDMNEPSVFNTPTHTMPARCCPSHRRAGLHPRTATHAEIHDVYGMENSRATFEGLLNARSEPAALCSHPRHLRWRPALCGYMDRRQQQQLEPSPHDHLHARESRPERLRLQRRGCGRLRRNAIAGSADEVARDRRLSAHRPRPYRERTPAIRSRGLAVLRRKPFAATLSKNATT